MPFDPKTAPPIDFMRYRERTQEAMRDLVRRSLADIARDGLIGSHHVMVKFDTTARGVDISQKLREQFPAEMSVMLQHQFAELKVDDTRFSVVLWFASVPERITVPFAAMTGFDDPSVGFGLEFTRPANINRPPGAKPAEPATPVVVCGFCGQLGDDSRKLALGRNTAICSECAVNLAAELSEGGASPPQAPPSS